MKKQLFIRLRTAGQLDAVLEWVQGEEQVPVLILDHGLAGSLSRVLDIAPVYLCLPDVARQSRIESVEQMISGLPEKAGLAVRNPDELGMLLQTGHQGPLIGDPFLYAYNREAIFFYREYFPSMQFILSDELTDRELRELTKEEPESFIYKIYGYQPLMITNQCMSRNYTDCREKKLEFRDGKGNRFTAVSSCSQCVSTIYNGLCTSMLDKLEEIPYRNLLIDLTTEDKKDALQILRGKLPEVVTRGHHYKGID